MTADTVLLVDDDAAVRESTPALLRASGFTVLGFASAKALLAAAPEGQCLLADIRMPEMDGLQLQAHLARTRPALPVVLITGHGDIPMAVRAMKAGVIDFIEKPFDDAILVASIRNAVEVGKKAGDVEAEGTAAREVLSRLTPRERDVFDQLAVGKANKVAAYALGISPRTVEARRANILQKVNGRSISDLVRLSVAAARRP